MIDVGVGVGVSEEKKKMKGLILELCNVVAEQY